MVVLILGYALPYKAFLAIKRNRIYDDIFNFVILNQEVKGFVIAFSRSGAFGNDEMVG